MKNKKGYLILISLLLVNSSCTTNINNSIPVINSSSSSQSSNQVSSVPASTKVVLLEQKENFDDQLNEIKIDGTTRTIFTTSRKEKGILNFKLSPDGNKILFSLIDSKNNVELYLIDFNGKNLTQITENSLQENQFVWSEDGKKLYFATTGLQNSDLYELEIENKNLKKIDLNFKQNQKSTNLRVTDLVKSPVKDNIFFSAKDETGNNQIYLKNLSNNELKQLTSDSSEKTNLFFNTDKKEIIFLSNQSVNSPLFKIETVNSETLTRKLVSDLTNVSFMDYSKTSIFYIASNIFYIQSLIPAYSGRDGLNPPSTITTKNYPVEVEPLDEINYLFKTPSDEIYLTNFSGDVYKKIFDFGEKKSQVKQLSIYSGK
jgi:Tol biopolymer transport system component